MKTANDFNKHLEKFRSGMSAGNILQAACSTKKRIGDVPIYNNTNKSISDTAIKVTFLQAGAFVNMDTIQRSIQRFTDTIKQ